AYILLYRTCIANEHGPVRQAPARRNKRALLSIDRAAGCAIVQPADIAVRRGLLHAKERAGTHTRAAIGHHRRDPPLATGLREPHPWADRAAATVRAPSRLRGIARVDLARHVWCRIFVDPQVVAERTRHAIPCKCWRVDRGC